MSIIQNLPSNILLIRLAGTVTLENINQMKGEFREKLRSSDRFGIVVDITEWSDMTADAIAEDAKWELGLLGETDRFPRLAIISNKQWVQAIQQYIDPLIPNVELKVFSPDACDDAIEFASKLPAGNKRNSTTGSIHQIETGQPKLLAFEIDGRLTAEEVQHVIEPLQAAFQSDEKIDLLIRLKEFKGFSPEILMQRSTMSMKFASLSHVRRYAIVGAEGWMKKIVNLFQPMVAIDMRTFDLDQEGEAWTWLKS